MPHSTDRHDHGQAAELAQIQAAYAVIQQRDGTAERRAWHWQMVCYGTLLLAALLTVSLLVVILRRTDVKAFVQLVQVNEDGRVIKLGLPQDLMSYEPQEGHWLDILAEWVRKMRWRGSDPVLARAEWNWVYAHTCGVARKALQGLEEKEKPFDVGKKLVTVDIKSVTKTPSPLSYQVLWTEMAFEGQKAPHTSQWTGTFTVQRKAPTSQAVLLQNRLGLCVNAFDITMQP